MLPQRHHTEAGFQKQLRMYLTLEAELSSVSHPDGTDFEDMKGSWKAAETWHCGRPREAIVESVASLASEGPGLKLRLGS